MRKVEPVVKSRLTVAKRIAAAPPPQALAIAQFGSDDWLGTLARRFLQLQHLRENPRARARFKVTIDMCNRHGRLLRQTVLVGDKALESLERDLSRPAIEAVLNLDFGSKLRGAICAASDAVKYRGDILRTAIAAALADGVRPNMLRIAKSTGKNVRHVRRVARAMGVPPSPRGRTTA